MTSSFGARTRLRLRRGTGALGSALLLGAVLTGAAQAAAPPPQASAACYGGLTRSPTSDEPNNVAYKFHCDSRITAYTVLVNRGRQTDAVDDFSTSALVTDPKGNINPATSFTCEGALPGPGVNCNAGGAFMGAWDYASGTFDVADPYCKSLPVGAKPGTKAIPTALVQLVVTDTSGAQDGPFTLDMPTACPSVPDKVPPKPVKHKKHKQTKKAKKTKSH